MGQTLTAGHCQVKATTASTPSCALGDESDPWSLFQKGEEGLWGEACSLLTSVQSRTKPEDVSLLLLGSFRSTDGNCWPKVLPQWGCVTMTSSYSCRLHPCFSHPRGNITLVSRGRGSGEEGEVEAD